VLVEHSVLPPRLYSGSIQRWNWLLKIRYMFQISRRPRGMNRGNYSKLQRSRSEPVCMTGRMTNDTVYLEEQMWQTKQINYNIPNWTFINRKHLHHWFCSLPHVKTQLKINTTLGHRDRICPSLNAKNNVNIYSVWPDSKATLSPWATFLD
jgi:hypothetical protein